MEQRIIRTRLFVQLNVLAVLVTIASVLQWHTPLAAATDVDEESDGDSDAAAADVREDLQEEGGEDDEDGEELNDDEQNVGDSDEGTAKQGLYSDRRHQKRKKFFVPVFVPDKEKKKMKIISVDKGFYVQGGTQLFGKFKSLKHCMKACATDSSCFEGDFNPWLHKCYAHTNTTACGKRSSHPQYVHFSKVPCDAPRGKIVIGATMGNGIEVKGVENIQQCIKKCVNAGRGVVTSVDYAGQQFALQACFAIDYDFANHKCFVFGSNIVQAAPVIYAAMAMVAAPPATPIQSYYTVWTQCNVLPTLGSAQGAHPNPSGVHITFCPLATLRGFSATG